MTFNNAYAEEKKSKYKFIGLKPQPTKESNTFDQFDKDYQRNLGKALEKHLSNKTNSYVIKKWGFFQYWSGKLSRY